ncbi:multiheme c-type cytochrome [Arenicella xantha]|uniref:Cytochrome c554/c'-like protein n=1 Tax=Arenicella xantha TaxID=644221 RepID=A0A395JF08_9GAMM|nr:multiheme c-type cytochrome [Arenicella xantha]RBP47138.1 cytochrome c554/c'-like protein [Arenicella xantha]
MLQQLSIRSHAVLACLIASCVLISSDSLAQINNAESEHSTAHLGVASCSASTCHGSTVPYTESNVLQNEFRTWYELDPHARAYQTLLTDESAKIARKLGLESASTADTCLTCHADNVAPAQRGADFRLQDGVGCEACHGGAENYLKSHTLQAHIDNLSAGLRKTEDPLTRGKLCVSCHVGGQQTRQITHQIMGAGHPRLSFELNTFSSIQPAHYMVDEDYRQRKGEVSAISTWAMGQVVAAEQLLLNVANKPRAGLFPELSHMDCLGCHQSMSKITWMPDSVTQLPSGTLRYQDAHLLSSYRIASVVAPEMAPTLLKSIRKFLTEAATQENPNTLVQPLTEQLSELQLKLAASTISAQQTYQLIAALVDYGIESGHHSYASAEQLAMGLNSLFNALSQSNFDAQTKQRLIPIINELFTSAADPERYNAAAFMRNLRRIKPAMSEL